MSEVYILGIIGFIVLVVWEGNRLTALNLSRLQTFFPPRTHPMLVMLLVSIVVVIATIGTICLCFYFIGEAYYITSLNLKLSLGFGFRVNLFLNCLNAIFYFMNETKKAQLEAEEFKKISIEAQFQALKNQINPHFLFNSLTALSKLIQKNQEVSVEFVNELSKVYRYLLNYQDNSVVKLEEELQFINSYIFLLNIRFKDTLHIQNCIGETSRNFYVAPASLQILIENAIKHNIVSKKNPLHIYIFDDEEKEFLTVQNNLQEKSMKEASTNIGLSNIINRYKFLTEKKVQVTKGEKDFTVKIPLLRLSNI